MRSDSFPTDRERAPSWRGTAPSLLVLALLSASGCVLESDEPADFGREGQLYIDYLATLDEITSNTCACEVEGGLYESVDECWVANGGPALPPPLAECIAGVLDGQSVLEETLACWVGRQRAYLDCLQAAPCDDLSARYSCEENFYLDACDSLPYEVEGMITEACYGYSLPPPFYCDDGRAIPEYWVCDGYIDCGDFADEQDCGPLPGWFMCGSGESVPESWVCDGFAVCEDGSDEQGCPPQPGQFTCGSGESVPESWVCDGAADCADGSDEQDCGSLPGWFECGSGEAVPESWVCNGTIDCDDGSDEQGCPPPPDSFRCGSGEYVPDTGVCDGAFDCEDSSDEEFCDSFTCGSGESVPERWVCDGFSDCEDDSDEAGCETFTCRSGESVPELSVCDGSPDCEDGSDEAGC